MTERREAIAPHGTPTDDGAWDAAEMVARLPSQAGPLREAHAWVDPEGDPDAKSSYKFPHHFVSEGGDVGAASTRACSAGIAVLNGARGGADIPEADREGVWEHLARHLRDAEQEPPPLRKLAVPGVARKHGTSVREFRRFPSQMQLRTTEAGTTTVVGYAAVFERPYVVYDWMGEYEEIIARGAFAKTLREGDVRFLYDHEGLVLARSKSGTLRLQEDERGLRYEAEVDLRQQAARDLVIAIERGDIDQSSFAFRAVREEWSEDYSRRRILEVQLYDVSAVAFPANDATSVSLGTRELLEAIRSADPRRVLTELREGKVLSAANKALVKDAIAALQALLAAAGELEEEEQPAARDACSTMDLELARAVVQAVALRRP